jgi:hypothetical protein
MMFKKIVLLGVIAGLLAGVASIIYARIYNSSLGTDFSYPVKPVGIIAASTFGGILASVGYWLFSKWLKANGEIIFNFAFTILSLASIIGPFAITLPLDIEMPELFPGLVIPMHFFPALAWFTLKPLFVKELKVYSNKER